MPAFDKPVNNNDIYQATTFVSLFGQLIMNTYFYRLKVLDPDIRVYDVYQSLHDHLNDADSLYATLMACMPTTARLYQTRIQRVAANIAPARIAFREFDQDVNGGAGATQVCNTDAVIVRRGDAANRGDVGKLFVAIAPVVANVVNGELTAGMKILLDVHCEQILVKYIDAGSFELQPCIYHRARPVDQASDITQAFPMLTSRVMTRRTVGRGV